MFDYSLGRYIYTCVSPNLQIIYYTSFTPGVPRDSGRTSQLSSFDKSINMIL